jgi:hypothetical protein
MISDIFKDANSDARLAALIEEAREYAQAYLLSKQRHKGCEGTGELMTLREELRDAIGKLEKYCGEKGCPCYLNVDDADAAARELLS